jgi:outer membrane immunogenic protein
LPIDGYNQHSNNIKSKWNIKMKTYTGIILTSLLLAHSPVKADEYHWQGLYGGIHFNQSWGINQDKLKGYEVVVTGGSSNQKWTTDSPQLTGKGAGLHLGYQWLNEKWLSGIEARVSSSDQHGNERTVAGDSVGGASNAINTIARVHYDTKLLAKFGTLISPQQSIYALAGITAAEVKTKLDYTPALNGSYETHPSTTDIETGWSLGVGTEYKFTDKLSLRAEALYTDLGKSKRLQGKETQVPGRPFVAGDAYAVNGKVDLKYSTLQFGMNYAF